MTRKSAMVVRFLTTVILLGANQRTVVVRADETEQPAFSSDSVEDSFFDALAADPSCVAGSEDCFSPPESTVEVETTIDATCFKGGDDHSELDDDENGEGECTATEQTVDRHWGTDPKILSMRKQLYEQAKDPLTDSRPPIFLLPGLASTRLIAWKLKKCMGAFSRNIKVQDNVWLNINLVIQMGTVNVDCMKDCLKLGLNQSDTDDWEMGCKLRPDEGLDAIASLAPGGVGSNLLVGGTNTVYSWLIQWLADNLGYDVTNVIGFPYDWRLTPDMMETRDGFLSMMRRKMEASVSSNGHPGIVVAHSMGNLIFRYFSEWLRIQMREESYNDYAARARRRARSLRKAKGQTQQESNADENSGEVPGWMAGGGSGGNDGLYDWLMAQEVNGEGESDSNDEAGKKNAQLWELAVIEGDEKWLEWMNNHVWTYVGLSAPMLGAVNPLRAVISGENMGLPITDAVAREMELTFGSTHTINPVSTSSGFCSEQRDKTSDETPKDSLHGDKGRRLSCLDDVLADIELSSVDRDQWKHFPALEKILKDRIDWDTGKPMVEIEIEQCQDKPKGACELKMSVPVGPKDAETGEVFNIFNELWREEGEPLIVKREQLEQAFWRAKFGNLLNQTWERPLIKHVIMGYGVDIPTEVGYIYSKKIPLGHNADDVPATNETSTVPSLKSVIWEGPKGEVTVEQIEALRGGIADHFIKKKVKRDPLDVADAKLSHSGDGSVPYLSLSWVQTWLLHAARAKRFSDDDKVPVDEKNVLDFIDISHRPFGGLEWVEGPPPKESEEPKRVDTADTGIDHPHGTRYKPEMLRYHNVGVSRTTGIEYTTSVIEAIGVEHKETTRNFDILAAVFGEVLGYMNDDLGLI